MTKVTLKFEVIINTNDKKFSRHHALEEFNRKIDAILDGAKYTPSSLITEEKLTAKVEKDGVLS